MTDTPSPRGPRFDFTVNLGHVVSVSAMILTMVVGWVQFDNRLQRVETALQTVTDTFVGQVEMRADLRAVVTRIERLERIVETRIP